MIFCLAAAHVSIFNTPLQAFFYIKPVREAFFCLIHQFLPANIFSKFYLILLHLGYVKLIFCLV